MALFSGILYEKSILEIIADIDKGNFKIAFRALEKILEVHDAMIILYVKKKFPADYEKIKVMDSAFNYVLAVLSTDQGNISNKKDRLIERLKEVLPIAKYLDNAIMKTTN